MTKYCYSLLLVITLLLSSCRSVELLPIDYMIPADVSFPNALKRVAVVNNMPTIPDNKLIVSESAEKKNEGEIARITNYYNGDAQITTESLAMALAEENYFEEVVICDSALRSKDIAHREGTLSQNEVIELTQDLKVDFLIALENIQMHSIRKTSYLRDWGAFYGTVDVKVYPTIKIYIPSRKEPMVTISCNDSIFWEETTSTEGSLNKNLIQEEDLIKEASSFAGVIPTKQLLPYWKTDDRYYFTSGSINMRDAAIFAKEGSWNEAIRLWKKDYETKKGKKKIYAAFNIALGYEFQDSIENALGWAIKAQETAYKVDKVDKLTSTKIKIKEMPNYLMTTIYVNKLQERKNNMTHLQIQMSRFNED